MIKNIALILIIFTNMHLAFSQYTWTDGEVILKGGEVLSGEIRIPLISKDLISFNGKSKVRVKNKSNGKRAVFDENQVELIKFIYPDSKIAYYKYIPVSKNKKELFCIVTSGSATLYGRAVRMTSSSPGMMTFHNLNEFYIQRLGEEIASPLKTARPSKSFRKRALEYFNDCPSIANKIKNRIKSIDEIIAVVNAYNQCVNNSLPNGR